MHSAEEPPDKWLEIKRHSGQGKGGDCKNHRKFVCLSEIYITYKDSLEK